MNSTCTAEIRALTAKHELLTANIVVTWAKNHPKSALHASLEWNNARAGAKYRLEQARGLIRKYRIEVEYADGTDIEGVHDVRGLVSLRTDRGNYRDMNKVLRSKSLRAALLLDAHNDYVGFYNKYHMLKELTELFEAGDAVFRDVDTTKKKAS